MSMDFLCYIFHSISRVTKADCFSFLSTFCVPYVVRWSLPFQRILNSFFVITPKVPEVNMYSGVFVKCLWIFVCYIFHSISRVRKADYFFNTVTTITTMMMMMMMMMMIMMIMIIIIIIIGTYKASTRRVKALNKNKETKIYVHQKRDNHSNTYTVIM